MTDDPDEIARALLVSVGLLRRQLRQTPADGELTLPEISALSRLDRGGPTTPSALARTEQISPQSMGTTLGGLQARGLVERRPDPADGRRVVFSVTDKGRQLMGNRRDTRAGHLARALTSGFTPAERRDLMAAVPLIERLAQSL